MASISGAFHGVMTAVTPDGAQDTSSRWPRISSSPPSSSPSQSAKNRKFCAARGITLARCERSSAPLSAVSTAASSAPRASIPSAIACSTAARSFGGVADQPPNASPAARTAAATSASPTSSRASSSVGDSNSSRVASPDQAGPASTLALPERTSSSSASGAPFSIEGTHRWCAIGCALTNPAAGACSASATTAWASRRSAAARVPAKVPPGAILGAARPNGWALVWWIDPSFFGYPWCSPRTSAKSASTQM